ncbi:MAG: nucleotide exchange factor GrpE [Candidatus Aminicenantes bacterium]|nr:nucleotide exchange factor GrpE [Candidatus Aminicenantes bacterium]
MSLSDNKKNGEDEISELSPKEPPSQETESAPPAGEDAKSRERGRHAHRKEKSQEHRGAAGEKESDLEILLRERDELRDKYLRSRAEVENQRKRAEREKNEFFQFALAEALRGFLEVADSLERALSAEGKAEEGEGFQEGVRRIRKQLLDVLAKNGVTPIADAVGSPFDPNVHQAFTTEASDEVEEPRVKEELQRGYRLHDRLLRPALVRVLVPKKDDQT